MAYHPTSKTVEWGTPQDLFDQLHAEFSFVLDACASPDNAKCDKYYTKEQDGLSQNWEEAKGPVFLNPPYGREIADWVAKASQTAATVVALLPARTDTQWFHKYILGCKAEIRWLPGRLYFQSADFKPDRAPFPSMIVVWRNQSLSAKASA